MGLIDDRKVRRLLTEDDLEAIAEEDHEFLNSKGVACFGKGEFEKARAFYELATTFGDKDAPTNLGYMYLYGKGAQMDYSLALAFFQIGASKGSVDAHYKLGDIYHHGKGVEQDTDKALEYYQKSLDLLEKENKADPADYPSLFFTLGKEMMPDGIIEENPGRAYDYLLIAEEGYEKQLEQYGATQYRDILDATRKLLRSEFFDEVKRQVPPTPTCQLYDKVYKVKGTNVEGTLIKSYYSYELKENIYILEDANHNLVDIPESELAELIQE
jgi:hypothetical protein